MLQHLQLALDEDRPIRLIIARLKNNPNAEVGGLDASNEPKVIIPYPDRVGKVVELTANNLMLPKTEIIIVVGNRYSSRTPQEEHCDWPRNKRVSAQRTSNRTVI
jgi:hypothetical protein